MSALVITQPLPAYDSPFPFERRAAASPLNDKPVLPPTSEAGKNTPQESAEKMQKAQESLKEKENQGFETPQPLKKDFEFRRSSDTAYNHRRRLFPQICRIYFPSGGVAHFIFILGTVAIPTVVAGGFIALLFELIKQGALPCIIGGITIFKMGTDLTTNNSKEIGSSISTASWVFPSLLYTWVSQVPPPSPGNPIH